MKKTLLALLCLALAIPVKADQVATTTATVTISGQTITYNVSPVRSPGYYRLAYDSTTKAIAHDGLVFSVGTTKTVFTLYCADSYAEVQAFVTANSLAGLPADPHPSH